MNKALATSTVVGTILQVAMVVLGHNNDAIKNNFAVAGTGISAVTGLLYSLLARGQGITQKQAAGNGAVAGGLSALIGIAVSVFGLKDVPAAVLGFGTGSGAVAGVIGGVLGKMLGSKSAA